MDENRDGVQITTREIYDKLNEVAHSVGGLGHRMESIERNLSDMAAKANNAEDLSREAKMDAEEAIRVANDAYKKALETNKSVEEDKENKRAMQNKVVLAVVSAAAPYLIAGTIALFYFGRSVLGG